MEQARRDHKLSPHAVEPPRSLGIANRKTLTADPLTVLSGAIPDDLRGSWFFHALTGTAEKPLGAPNRVDVPALNSDGYVVRVDMSDAGATLTARVLETTDWLADELLRKGSPYPAPPGSLLHLLRTFASFKDLGLIRRSPLLGVRNMNNTAFVPWMGEEGIPRMLVTWDAGRPWEIDLKTLDAVTVVGKRTEWLPEADHALAFPAVLTTAHPVYDQDHQGGTIWLVDYGKSAQAFLSQALVLRQIADAVMAQRRDFVRWALSGSSGVPKKLLVAALELEARARIAVDMAFPFTLNTPALETFTQLKRWDGTGDLMSYRLVSEAEDVLIHETVHQVAASRNHVVLLDTGVRADVGTLAGRIAGRLGALAPVISSIAHRSARPYARLHIVDKRKLAQADAWRAANTHLLDNTPDVSVVSIDLPQEASHFLVERADSDGLSLIVGHSGATDVGAWLRPWDRGVVHGTKVPDSLLGLPSLVALDINRLARYTIDPSSGEIIEVKALASKDATWTVALPAEAGIGRPTDRTRPLTSSFWCSLGFHDRLVTLQNWLLHETHPDRLVPAEAMLERLASREPIPASVFLLDHKQMEVIDQHKLPAGAIPSSPQFVPRRRPLDGVDLAVNGWLLCVVFPPDVGGKPAPAELWIYDASQLANGPVCRLDTGGAEFGYSVHAAWCDEEQVANRVATYAVPLEDTLSAVSGLAERFLRDELIPLLRSAPRSSTPEARDDPPARPAGAPGTADRQEG
ncbi:MAG: carotenoid oxygenase family protein [Deltaproteobacteria bacterium]|nr:carotenoid oxygenase family protein [Deltaproteobacteria bacterium]